MRKNKKKPSIKKCTCGGIAKVQECGYDDYAYVVECVKCRKKTEIYDAANDAIRVWNGNGKKIRTSIQKIFDEARRLAMEDT